MALALWRMIGKAWTWGPRSREPMDDITIARAVHVLAVVHWIGGVSFVTAVILPIGNSALFQEVERRFSAQVRVSVPIAGITGLYMSWRLDAWERFLQPASWWMPAMALLWLLFMAMLFVVEPLFGREDFGKLSVMRRVHWVLLLAASIVVMGAVGGAHGLFD